MINRHDIARPAQTVSMTDVLCRSMTVKAAFFSQLQYAACVHHCINVYIHVPVTQSEYSVDQAFMKIICTGNVRLLVIAYCSHLVNVVTICSHIPEI